MCVSHNSKSKTKSEEAYSVALVCVSLNFCSYVCVHVCVSIQSKAKSEEAHSEALATLRAVADDRVAAERQRLGGKLTQVEAEIARLRVSVTHTQAHKHTYARVRVCAHTYARQDAHAQGKKDDPAQERER